MIVFEPGIHMLHSPIHIQYVSDIVITSINTKVLGALTRTYANEHVCIFN